MDIVYFVDAPYVKAHTPINLNVDTKLINLAIIDAQILRIQPILGSKLYKKLESMLKLKTINDVANANYKTLLDDYVSTAVTQWTLVECLPYIRFKIMNKSVSGQSSDNSTPVDLEELKYLSSTLINKAEFHTQRVADHLMNNLSTYPEYHSGNTIEDIQPSTNAYFSGMQLDEFNWCDRYIGYNSHTKDFV